MKLVRILRIVGSNKNMQVECLFRIKWTIDLLVIKVIKFLSLFNFKLMIIFQLPIK